MTISELGSLGELVVSIAVLVTLVYFSIQIRLVRTENAAARGTLLFSYRQRLLEVRQRLRENLILLRRR